MNTLLNTFDKKYGYDLSMITFDIEKLSNKKQELLVNQIREIITNNLIDVFDQYESNIKNVSNKDELNDYRDDFLIEISDNACMSDIINQIEMGSYNDAKKMIYHLDTLVREDFYSLIKNNL